MAQSGKVEDIGEAGRGAPPEAQTDAPRCTVCLFVPIAADSLTRGVMYLGSG